jgi:hypothetical protein
MKLLEKDYDREIFKSALRNLLKSKDYHVAAPTKKNKMLIREYTRIFNIGKELKGG